MQRDMFPPPHAHPQLQAFEAIESSHALLVHGPAVTAQQDPDAQEPEAWPRVRKLADTEAQRRLILLPTLSLALAHRWSPTRPAPSPRVP